MSRKNGRYIVTANRMDADHSMARAQVCVTDRAVFADATLQREPEYPEIRDTWLNRVVAVRDWEPGGHRPIWRAEVCRLACQAADISFFTEFTGS